MSPTKLRGIAAAYGLSLLALLTLGFVMLASTGASYAHHGDVFFYAKRQAIWLGLGLLACLTTSFLPYGCYRRSVWWVFGTAAVLLVLVLVFGKRINGAVRWLVIGPVRFQPSEFAKYALVITLACWLERVGRASKRSSLPRVRDWRWGVLVPAVISGFLAVLILKEPDLGTTLLLGMVTLAMMCAGGVSWVWLTAIVTSIAAGATWLLVAIFKWGMFHQYYQVQRLVHWWLQDDLKGCNYQQHMAQLAFGSGGVWGVGLGNSRMKLGFLPEAHTDFILPIIGEELGLVGTLAVVIAFAVAFFSGMLLARRAPDAFGRLLGSGIMIVIGVQALINIAVVTNTVPNKGMALPFISYGGSNLFMTLAAVGIVFNIYRQAHAQAITTD
jgi:cell division protein FtsW